MHDPIDNLVGFDRIVSGPTSVVDAIDTEQFDAETRTLEDGPWERRQASVVERPIREGDE
jgi:hypothetical protein